MQLVVDSLKEDAARKSFVVEVKSYRESKEKAQDKVVLSQVVMANVQVSDCSSAIRTCIGCYNLCCLARAYLQGQKDVKRNGLMKLPTRYDSSE